VLGARLRELRMARGLTQQSLADALGVGQTTITNYETNTREPDNATLQKLADFFDVSADYLLGRTNFKGRPWWEKDKVTDIELEEFIKNQSDLKLMGDSLDEETKADVLLFLRTAHEFIKQKRRQKQE